MFFPKVPDVHLLLTPILLPSHADPELLNLYHLPFVGIMY